MYVIGLDIGTTCTKALAVDDRGQVAAAGSSGYELFSRGGCVKQRAEDWILASVKAVREAVKRIPAHEVAGLSVSAQGGSTVAVDDRGNFIGNSITWMDTRAQKEADEIEEELGGEYIYHTSGWKINPALDAAKIRYMKRDRAYKGADMYLTTLEVVNRFLTGEPVIDPTNAAMRQLYNVEKNDWDEKLMKAAGVTREELPIVRPTSMKIGELQREAACKMGIREGIPVFNGAHDQYCASIGAGAVHEGDMLLSAGTTWVLMGIGEKPLFTKSYIAPGKHPVEGLYGAMASLVCSGASLQWFKNEFLPEDFGRMNEEAAARREKAKDLFFYPYLTGAFYPNWNVKAKGILTGFTLEHDRFDFARAIMEGVSFGVKRAVKDFSDNGCGIRRITMMGGASKSFLWCQMIASVTGIPILRLNRTDICALGAAMIAACRLGVYKDYHEAAEHMVHVGHRFEPIPEETEFYEEKYGQFLRMWENVRKYYEQ